MIDIETLVVNTVMPMTRSSIERDVREEETFEAIWA